MTSSFPGIGVMKGSEVRRDVYFQIYDIAKKASVASSSAMPANDFLFTLHQTIARHHTEVERPVYYTNLVVPPSMTLRFGLFPDMEMAELFELSHASRLANTLTFEWVKGTILDGAPNMRVYKAYLGSLEEALRSDPKLPAISKSLSHANTDAWHRLGRGKHIGAQTQVMCDVT